MSILRYMKKSIFLAPRNWPISSVALQQYLISDSNGYWWVMMAYTNTVYSLYNMSRRSFLGRNEVCQVWGCSLFGESWPRVLSCTCAVYNGEKCYRESTSTSIMSQKRMEIILLFLLEAHVQNTRGKSAKWVINQRKKRRIKLRVSIKKAISLHHTEVSATT